MTIDEKMREIEAALRDFLAWAMWPDGYPDGLKAKLLALIRAAITSQTAEPFKKTPGSFAKLADAMMPHLNESIACDACDRQQDADAEHEAKVEVADPEEDNKAVKDLVTAALRMYETWQSLDSAVAVHELKRKADIVRRVLAESE